MQIKHPKKKKKKKEKCDFVFTKERVLFKKNKIFTCCHQISNYVPLIETNYNAKAMN